MSLTFNTKTYTADSFSADAVSYNGPAKTMTVIDTLKLAKSQTKGSATFSGVVRVNDTLSRTLTLTGALSPTGLAYAKIEVQVPVGAASADVDALLNDFGALVSGADFKTHVKTPKVNY